MQRLVSLVFAGSAIVLMSFNNPATAGNGKPAKAVTSTKKATTFQVDKTQSKLNWVGKKVTGQHSGTIDVSDGKLDLENNVLKGGSFSLDTRSITVTDIKDASGNAKLLGHLKSEDFFGVEKFPAANFVITKVTPKSNGSYDVTGNLTIKGITNAITFPATVVISGAKLTAKADIKVDRTKYNIRYGSKSFFEGIGDKAIYDDFDLAVELVANAQ
ncbi:YceI family protein [Chitinophaga qingshengii]|uniref:YceI family protein n=1 Tax=Chitinophaga qingshengii TaxID=1569794 RepID=A0ABR7TFF1_9BACT|nr:YceI family protein [Chitinophaga qingshengii]MBC9929044.1 YceI family protein [Chitinophaga qingshengii]